MTRRLCLSAICLSLCAAQASAFDLISKDEWQRESAEQAKPHPKTRSVEAADPNAYPKILITQPAKVDDVAMPVTIEVKFDGGPVAIDPDSFKVFYGWMSLDITDRLRKVAKITPAGILASGAELPAGSHSLKLQVADVQGHTASTVVKFKVVKSH